MSNQQLQDIRQRLEAALAVAVTPTLPGSEPGAGDVCERALSEMESDLAVAAINLRWRTAKDVESALRRLESASYGVCESCEGPIGTKRLRALPWASRCIGCQSADELATQGSQGPGSLWGDWPDVFFGGIQ
ncbi:MAG: TraR/DksA family transcriptional regulator [Acidobacteria bacterium]|nr:TraR/DksA family transcriptional regulator [Acidobacteriota bacterium]